VIRSDEKELLRHFVFIDLSGWSDGHCCQRQWIVAIRIRSANIGQ